MLQVIFMDAGQGDATLLVYPDSSLVLVDCGCKKNRDVVDGEIRAVLNSYLKKTGNHLKALVLTHADGDHYNLVNDLIVKPGVTVGTVYHGQRREDYSGLTDWINKQKQVPFAADHSSDVPVSGLSLAGTEPVTTYVLSANAGVLGDANANSVVLLVRYLDVALFLMGDATEVTEKHIVSSLGKKLDALLKGTRRALKAGHHGSATSSKKDWIKTVAPEVCFISSDTRSFSGTSIPRSGVIDGIVAWGKIYDFGKPFRHHYVQYNDSTHRHEAVSSQLGLFTTLYLLKFQPKPHQDEFTAYGTSWYYTLSTKSVEIAPACGWDQINKAF